MCGGVVQAESGQAGVRAQQAQLITVSRDELHSASRQRLEQMGQMVLHQLHQQVVAQQREEEPRPHTPISVQHRK